MSLKTDSRSVNQKISRHPQDFVAQCGICQDYIYCRVYVTKQQNMYFWMNPFDKLNKQGMTIFKARCFGNEQKNCCGLRKKWCALIYVVRTIYVDIHMVWVM